MKRLLAAIVIAVLIVLAGGSAQASDKTNLWVFGDSIAAGGWLADPSQGWVGDLAASLPNTEVTNYSVPGMAFHECCTTKAVILDAVKAAFTKARAENLLMPDVVMVAAGTNDVIGHELGAPAWSGKNLYYSEYAATLVAAYLRAQGVTRILWNTIYPFAASNPTPPYPGYVLASWVPSLMDRLTSFNIWLTAMYGSSVINSEWVLVDWSCWCRGSSRWFLDGFHPNEAGHAQLAWAIQRSAGLS